MIQYKKSSWHYRLMVWAWVPPWAHDKSLYLPDNLCPYMRALMATMFLAPFLSLWRKLPSFITMHQDIARATVAWFFISHGVSTLINLGIGDGEELRDGTMLYQIEYLGWYVFFGGYAVALAAVGVVLGADKLNSKYKQRPRANHETITLVRDYVSAKHNKVCPNIEFVDDAEESEEK